MAYGKSHCEDWLWKNEGTGLIGAVSVAMWLL